MMTDERADTDACVNPDDLVVQAKRDRAAFSLLYERYYPEVSRYCLRRLFVRDLAEDVISAVFLDVASHLPQFPGTTDTDFRRWIFRIATNAINEELRQTLRRRKLLEAAVQSRRLVLDHDSIKGQSPDDWPDVYQAIMELDERDRSIVMLRFFSNCSYEEIADVVSAKPGTVRTALCRILARLREKLKTNSILGSPPTG